jgi:hypothetical protein
MILPFISRPTWALLLAVPLLAQTLTGCTLNRNAGRKTVRIEFPKSAPQVRLRAPASRVKSAAVTLADVNCYALNITGDGLVESTPGANCVAGSGRAPVGLTSGWISASQGSISLDVPMGANRRIELLGRVSSACSGSVEGSLASGSVTIHSLASTVTDIATDTTVTLQAALDPDANPWVECADAAAGGTDSGGAEDSASTDSVWDTATWDQAVWGD